MYGKAKKCVSIFLTAALAISAFVTPVVYAAENEVSKEIVKTTESTDGGYNAYLKQYESAPLADSDVKATVSADGATVKWNGEGDFTVPVSVAKSGMYNIDIVWESLEKGLNIELSVLIDGELPFQGTETVYLKRIWTDAEDKPRTDSAGNEYAQEQKEIGGKIESPVRDAISIISEPYKFYFEAGNHTITLRNAGQAIGISEINLTAPEQVESYNEVSATYNPSEFDADIITIQAENADIKNSKSILAKSNNSDAGMTPTDPYKAKINFIGGTTWQSPGDTITWNFDVEKSGYYKIDMRYMQSDLINGESIRILRVNDKIPFEEAKNLKFEYCTSWKYYSFADSKEEPYLIWLDEGPNTISLECTVGDQTDYYYRLSDIAKVLGDEYIKIVMITGETPDVNRDYELFKQIPNFTETITEAKEGLDSLSEDMKKTLGTRTTQFIAAVENMSRVIDNMLRSPYLAHQYLTDYYDNYTSLSSWLYEMNNMPLSLDEIQLVPYGKEYENKNANFFSQLYYGVVRFISSFGDDYQVSKSDIKEGDRHVSVWVNWGQDQATALNSLIEQSFTHDTGIKVDMKIVSISLLNAMLSGNFPDVSLQMARTEPLNLGMRGALVDLTQFSDYEEVLKRFMPGADIPYWYNDGLYALPDTQTFFVMFCRTDILDSLGLEIPKTWDEFIHVSKIVQRNNMNAYLPYTTLVATGTVNAGIGSLNMLPTLMSQKGLEFYNEERTATDLMNTEAIELFTYWTDFYKEYSILKEADFYNRFRAGTMPIGITTYNTYMTLYTAAPEIKGRWVMAPVPGMADGGNTVAGGGTGCAIIEKSPNREEAWEFLKWWTSADMQTRYIANVESLLGLIGRPTTSNVEAFNQLGWDKEDLAVINEQWSRVRELPEVPGSYYLSRSVDQAFWAVVNGESNSRDALAKWSVVADDEIARKIKEYS